MAEVCNECGCPGAETVIAPQKCLRRQCYRFDKAHWRRFERAWATDAVLFCDTRVRVIVDWLASGAMAAK